MAPEPRAGLTFVEVMIGVTLTAMVFGLALVATVGTADVLSVTQASTRAHLEAERCLRLCLAELRRCKRDASGPTASATTLQAGDPDDALVFRQVLGVDPADPREVLRGDTLRITFEPDGDEVPANGVDDDGDGRIDEGRVALYRVGAPDQLVAVVAHDVTRFVVRLEEPTPDNVVVSLEVQVEQVIERAVRDAASAAPDARPRSRHTARGSLRLLN